MCCYFPFQLSVKRIYRLLYGLPDYRTKKALCTFTPSPPSSPIFSIANTPLTSREFPRLQLTAHFSEIFNFSTCLQVVFSPPPPTSLCGIMNSVIDLIP